MKRWLMTTRLGPVAVSLRERTRLAATAVRNHLEVGDLRNNALAGSLVTHLCRPGRTFIDVGAHIGSIIAEAARHGPGKIIAFEAIPEKAGYLAAHFPEVTIHNVALQDHDGEVSFFIDKRQSGYSSLAHRDANVEEILVKGVRMDSLVDDDDVDVMKIDVEGAELGVLRGASCVVERCRPTIMFESGPGNVLGYTKQAMWEWFAERGYSIYLPDRITRAARAATLDVFLDSHEYPRRTTNYFAIADERLHEVSARARELLNDPPDWRRMSPSSAVA